MHHCDEKKILNRRDQIDLLLNTCHEIYYRITVFFLVTIFWSRRSLVWVRDVHGGAATAAAAVAAWQLISYYCRDAAAVEFLGNFSFIFIEKTYND
jgi:hypothetical protein